FFCVCCFLVWFFFLWLVSVCGFGLLGLRLWGVCWGVGFGWWGVLGWWVFFSPWVPSAPLPFPPFPPPHTPLAPPRAHHPPQLAPPPPPPANCGSPIPVPESRILHRLL
ncbi:hypothetical protein, partial [Pseudomonas syringae group genomosp. 7]|uniref:hypothetical protein n=1 Tax=Pseudomonas syringae group genomosp. 7 TaxID=251699 RepID=UPI00376F5384